MGDSRGPIKTPVGVSDCLNEHLIKEQYDRARSLPTAASAVLRAQSKASLLEKSPCPVSERPAAGSARFTQMPYFYAVGPIRASPSGYMGYTRHG